MAEQQGGSSSSTSPVLDQDKEKALLAKVESNYLTPQCRRILALVNNVREERGVELLGSHKGLCRA